MSEICDDYKSQSENKKLIYALGLWRIYYNKYFSAEVVKEGEKIEAAFAFFYLHYFMFGGVSVSISGVNEKALNSFIKMIENHTFEHLIYLYFCRSLHKETIIHNNDAIELISAKDINTKQTLIYLDSPYIGTADPYPVPNKGGCKFNIKDLVIALAKYKGDFIFSCRATANAKGSSKKEQKGRFLIAQLFHWFEQLMICTGKHMYVSFSLYTLNKFVAENKSKTQKKSMPKDGDFIVGLIKEAIRENVIFEIMITNFGVRATRHNNFAFLNNSNSESHSLDYANFSSDANHVFCEIEFKKFSSIAKSTLVENLDKPVRFEDLF